MPSAHTPTPPEHETLRLDDALKLAGVAATGGEAKTLIQGGAVRVNGAVETRRKRKLVEGDLVEVGDDTFEIALADDEDADDEAPASEARDPDPEPIRAPGAGELEDLGDDPIEDEDEDDEDDDEDDDEERIRFGAWDDPAGGDPDDAADDRDDAVRLDGAELARWAAWIEDRVADDDVEAVIIRLGSLHPEALEAVFERLGADVEDRVLDALDEVLERAADDEGDLPLQA